VGNYECRAERVAAASDPGAVAREDRRHWLTRLEPIAGAGRDHEPDRRIGVVIDARSAAAHFDDSAADRSRLDSRHATTSRRAQDLALRGLGQNRRVVDDRGIPALGLDDSLKALGGASGADRLLELATRRVGVFG